MNDLADNHYQRASHLSEIGRWKEAIVEATKSLAADSSHYRALCTISRSHLELGDFKKAMEFAEKAIQADPKQEWAYRLQCAVYAEKKQDKKRLEAALEAIKQEPHSELALQNLVYAQLQRKNLKEARQTAEQLLQISPDSAKTHKTMGFVEFDCGKFPAAEECFRRALQIDAADHNSLILLGKTLLKKHEKNTSFEKKKEILNEAVDCFRQALVINPTSTEAKQFLKEAHLKTAAHTPLFILAFAYNLFLLAVLMLNKKQWHDYRPEFLNLDNKIGELSILYGIVGVCSMLTCYGIAGYFAEKSVSEPNRKLFDLVDKPTLKIKLVMIFWILVSAYPLFLTIWKLIALDFIFFISLRLFDWVILLIGLATLGLNCLFMFPYIRGQNKYPF